MVPLLWKAVRQENNSGSGWSDDLAATAAANPGASLAV